MSWVHSFCYIVSKAQLHPLNFSSFSFMYGWQHRLKYLIIDFTSNLQSQISINFMIYFLLQNLCGLEMVSMWDIARYFFVLNWIIGRFVLLWRLPYEIPSKQVHRNLINSGMTSNRQLSPLRYCFLHSFILNLLT